MAAAGSNKRASADDSRLILAQSAPRLSLAKLQEIAKEFGAAGSESDMRRVLNKELNMNTPFGELMQNVKIELANGEEYPALCCNPLALLYVLCSKERFAELFDTCCNGAFSVILYTDKLQVANPLHPDSSKELQAVYIRAAAKPDAPRKKRTRRPHGARVSLTDARFHAGRPRSRGGGLDCQGAPAVAEVARWWLVGIVFLPL